MKVVIDTNVLISAVLFEKSVADVVVSYCLLNTSIFFSEHTFLEFSSRITRSKFDPYSTLEKRKIFISGIYDSKNTFFCFPQKKVSDCMDLDDNAFLEVALECEADHIITGDKKHLLPLNPYRKISIISPREFFEKVVITFN